MDNLNFDEENDIILPANWYSELVYIKCILKDIFKKHNLTYTKQEFAKLKRQFLLWRKYIIIKKI